MDELTLVKYQTFIDHLESGGVSDVSIYTFSSNVEITYTHDEIAYGSKGVFGPINDPLLHQHLAAKSVNFTLIDEKYKGPEGDTSGMHNIFSGIFMVIPLLLIVVIIIQAQTIKRLSRKDDDGQTKAI